MPFYYFLLARKCLTLEVNAKNIPYMKNRLIAFFMLMTTFIVVNAQLQFYFDSEQHNPWSQSPHSAQALQLIEAEDLAEAINELDKELAEHPGNGYALCNKAFAIAFSVIDFNNDEEVDDGNDGDVLEALKEKRKPKLVEAINIMQEGLKLIPEADTKSRGLAWMYIAAFHRMMGCENDTVIADLEKSVELNPTSDVYEILLKLTLESGDMDKAEKLAKQALEFSPDNTNLIELMLALCHEKKDINNYVQYFERYKAKAKRGNKGSIDEDLEIAYAQALAATKGKEAAVDYLLNTFSDNCDYLWQGLKTVDANPEMELMKIGQREFAGEGTADQWNMLRGNICLFQQNDCRQALDYYRKISSSYDSGYLNIMMARCCYMTGDTHNALIHAQAFKYLEGTDLQLTQLQLKLGMVGPIIKRLAPKIEMDDLMQPSIDDYNTLALCYLLTGDYNSTVTILDKALKIEPESPQALLNCGRALKALGRDEEAAQRLEATFDANYDEENLFEQDLIQSQACALLGRDDMALKHLEAVENKWQQVLNESTDKQPTNYQPTCYDIAATWAMLGNETKVLEWMTKHFDYDFMPYNFGFMALDRRFDKVKDIVELRQLVEKKRLQWLNQQ